MGSYSELIPQLIIDGLTLGIVYSIVALGYTMVYGILEFINFANSEVFMFGAFAGTEALLFMQANGLLTSLPVPLALLIAIIFSALISGGLGVSIEKIAYKPIRNSPKLVALISAIGVSFFLQDFVRLIEGVSRNAFYLTSPEFITGKIIISKNCALPYKTLYLFIISILTMTILTVFIKKGKWGKAMRAVAHDQTTAQLMGINAEKTISLTFFIGAALGGVAGTLFAIQYSVIDPYVGFILGIKAFTAAVFGGIGNIVGTMIGGIILGLIETFGSAFLSTATGGILGSEYKDVLAFVILISLLIFRPNGIMGNTVGEKV